jgi:excisionase family DNA binding protein
MAQKRLLRPHEVAALLGISRSSCYRLLAAGQLPVCRVGRSIRTPSDELDTWITAHTEGSLIQETDEEGNLRIRRHIWSD